MSPACLLEMLSVRCQKQSRENKKRLKNGVLCREMESNKDEKQFWRDSIMVKLEKAKTRGENESGNIEEREKTYEEVSLCLGSRYAGKLLSE